MRTKLSNINTVVFFGDLILINLAFISGFLLKFHDFTNINLVLPKYIQLLFLFNFIWLVIIYLRNDTNQRIENRFKFYFKPLVVIGMHISVLSSIFFITKELYYSREMLLYSYLSMIVFILLFRLIHHNIFSRRRILGLDTIDILVVGYNNVTEELLSIVEGNLKYGFNIKGFFTDKEIDHPFKLGNIKDYPAYIANNNIDEVFCTLPLFKFKKIQNLFLTSDNELIRFRMLTDLRGIFNRDIHLDPFEKLTFVSFREEPLDHNKNKILKRLFDIVFSLLVIVFIYPILFPVLALLIKLDSKGPVFFKQMRSGLNNEEFYCYKFRTMTINDEASTLQTVKNDIRITKIGSFLRKTNLDEFPQFLNVLIGNMSIVGPRPHMIFHTEKYKKIVSQYMVRHFVKPGITGLAQVKGHRGETKENIQMEKRINADIYYIENWSLFLDIKIIFLTVYNMIKGEENAF